MVQAKSKKQKDEPINSDGVKCFIENGNKFLI